VKKYSQLALRATLLYGLIACIWILCSDRLLAFLIRDPLWINNLQTLKGIFFVAITAVLFYIVMRDQLRRWEIEADGRQQAESSLFRLAAIVESSDDAIISKSLDGLITSWNKGAENIFGYTEAEVLGKPMLILFPNDRIKEEQDTLASIARGENVRHYETVRIRKDGKRINVSATVSPIKDATGRIIGASKIARDITAQKENQRDVAWLSQIVEQSPVMLIITDLTGAIEYVNPAFIKVTGHAATEVMGKNPRLLKSGELPSAAYQELWTREPPKTTFRS
jgi:PAS domain S-box-containing protein